MTNTHTIAPPEPVTVVERTRAAARRVPRRLRASLRGPDEQATRRRTTLILAGICVLGVAIRLWGIDRFGFNSDEAVYAGQGASIVGVPGLSEIFPIFRAHPLLFQFLIGLLYKGGVSDLTPRLLSVVFGVGTIVLAYRLGRLLYGRTVGLLSALFLAVMPYHVLVTRQALLDGPMTFFATLTLYLLARHGESRRSLFLYAAAAAMGLTVLTKESGILYLSAAYAFFALNAEVRIRWTRALTALVIVFFLILPFPLSLLLGGGAGTGKSYLVWQLFREPNHTWFFYFSVVPLALGPLLLLAASLGLWESRRSWSWRETLLTCWMLVPLAFFQLWPVKGYQYPLPIAVPVAVLAARFLTGIVSFRGREGVPRWGLGGAYHRALTVAIVVATLIAATWVQVNATSTGQLLAGTGGVPGGREIGDWIRENTPEGARFMTIGPSMANLIQFYGERRAFGLSVSPNPLHRNPSYEPIENPDFQLFDNQIQYIVWDAYSASRSTFFSQKVLDYADRYFGRIVHQFTVPVETSKGGTTQKPVITIYAVRPPTNSSTDTRTD